MNNELLITIWDTASMLPVQFRVPRYSAHSYVVGNHVCHVPLSSPSGSTVTGVVIKAELLVDLTRPETT